VRLAARGTRNLDDGERQLDDVVLKHLLRRQARKVYAEAIVSAAVLTGLCLAIA